MRIEWRGEPLPNIGSYLIVHFHVQTGTRTSIGKFSLTLSSNLYCWLRKKLLMSRKNNEVKNEKKEKSCQKRSSAELPVCVVVMALPSGRWMYLRVFHLWQIAEPRKINLWELPSFQPVYWGLSYNSVWLLVLVLFDCLTLDCVKLNSCVVVFLGFVCYYYFI